MALILGGYSGGKTDSERIIELQSGAERVEEENQKRVRAHLAESQLELQKKKQFHQRPVDPPIVKVASGQFDASAIRADMSPHSAAAARDVIVRQLDEFNNR